MIAPAEIAVSSHVFENIHRPCFALDPSRPGEFPFDWSKQLLWD